MRGTDVGISEKKISRFWRLIELENRGKNEIFFWKVRHFVNFSKFIKSLGQYLGK